MKIFTPEFNELIKQTEQQLGTIDDGVLPPLHTYDELFGDNYVTEGLNFEERKLHAKELHEDQLRDLRFHAGSIAAVATSRGLELDAIIGWTRRKDDWLIWAERVEHPQSQTSWVHASILTKNGRLENVNPVIVKPKDFPSGYIDTQPKELSNERLLRILGRAGSRTSEVKLDASDLSYETHMQHLATWVVKNSLHIPKSSDSKIRPYADTPAGLLAYETDITNGIHRI